MDHPLVVDEEHGTSVLLLTRLAGTVARRSILGINGAAASSPLA
jgi:hypothetical protein